MVIMTQKLGRSITTTSVSHTLWLTLQSRTFRSRGWAFTQNNYTEAEEQEIKRIECTYKVVGKEVGEMGTPHLQGYMYFKNGRGFSSIKRELPERCHIEATKDEDYYEWVPTSGFIDGYDGERIAVFDDFKAELMNFEVWLQICDPWHNPAFNVKGGTTAFTADIVLFTSIQRAEDIWKQAIDLTKVVDDNQITDRVNQINLIKPNPMETEETEIDMDHPTTRSTFEEDLISNQL
ncbi:putative replication-associated protein [Monocercomonoides exilis]|uniref:putative replication-associated protein n=1 Tax=Monocercomonoides exilis TaxID=2049356 RepID=UPI00355A26F9|nr:putative replication-associated protein [Monocercomonoides exilis]|eukprot:MONOS_1167.1-p1 / transcript=MONOS_1167.1 / gene=MONOS_1167 / organism=Monocercomonoides_exilis_PA203 / gene_product=replication-associated protein / transcript_product=replication-associated protein / location=Mono_scaffold00020:4088-5181(-) / protein_length=235 / sequence_SO=supercontig / SO=protein_coding / is_pseudo=false